MTKKFTLATLLASIALILGACSSEAESNANANADDNDADVEFAQNMIPHHQQAVEMAELVPTRSADPEIISLAQEIVATQGPEIATMEGWLKQWGEDVPDESAGMDHGGHGALMPGMMSEGEMQELEDATGAAFDQAFLKQMIAHHEGAVTMATEEQSDGEFAEAIDLAVTIEKTQQSEILRMRDLLAR